MGEPRIRSLSFLTPGNFPDEDPYAGLEDTLGLFEFGERAGFDGAWIGQRHLEHGVSAGAVFLAAVAPPLGWKPAREQRSLQPNVPAGSVK